MRSDWATCVLTTGLLVSFAMGEENTVPAQNVPAAPPGKNAPAPKPNPTPAEREAAARAFVKEHHPELDALLDQLKPMRPAEYDRAIRELFNVSRSLDTLRTRDARRYQIGLSAWKAKSHVELMAAKLASTPADGDERDALKQRLRSALHEQLAVEIAQQKLERDLAAERIAKIEKNLERLEANPDRLVERRLQGVLKKSESARRKDVGKPSGPATPKPQGESRS